MKIGKISSEELQIIYGKLNRELIPITYSAKSTNTADVTVQDNKISVNTIRTPGTLRVVDNNTGTLCEYDGSSDVTINTNESNMLARLKVLEQLLEKEKLLNQQLEDIIERLVTVEDQVESSVVEPTAIDPVGTYDKIYFNTGLTYEQAAFIFNQLTFIDSTPPLYLAFASNDGGNDQDGYYMLAIKKDNSDYTLCGSIPGVGEVTILDKNGWSSGILYLNGVYEPSIPLNGVDTVLVIPVGQQNELLKDVFSSTPFKNNPSVAIIDVAELPNPTTGDIITSTGTYDTFYFNTSLSVAEVDSILSKLPYKDSAYCVYKYDNYRPDGGRITFDVITIINKDYASKLGLAGEGYMIVCSRDLDTLSIIYNSFESGFGGAPNEIIGWQGIESYSFNPTYVENPVYIAGEQNNLLRDLIYAEKVLDVSQINTKVLYRTPDGVLWYCNGQWIAVGGEVLKLNLSDIESTPMSDDIVDKVLNNKISKIELTLVSDETGGFVIYLEPSFVMNVGDKAHIIYSNVNLHIFDNMKPWLFGITLNPDNKIFVRAVDTMLLSKTDMTGLYPPANMSSSDIQTKTLTASDTFIGWSDIILDFADITANYDGYFDWADDIMNDRERTLYLKNLKSDLTYTIRKGSNLITNGTNTTLYNYTKYNTSDIVKIVNDCGIKLTSIAGNIMLQYNYDTNIWTLSDGFVGTLSESE